MELTAAYRDIYKRPHSPGACHCATRDKLHVGPDPSHVLYFTVYMILALEQLLQVLSYSLHYPAPCRIV